MPEAQSQSPRQGAGTPRRDFQHISASVDGAAAILQELVAHEDLEVSRQSFAVADLLERLSTELDQVAGLVETMESHYDADA